MKRKPFVVAIVTLIAILLLTLQDRAFAFDTGHHYDLTWQVMRDEGFSDTALETAQVENWLVDYYSSSPTGVLSFGINNLHFDNLHSTEQVSNYWGRLAVSTKAAIQQAARENDALKGLTVLGISLHTVQDFYSHSNWVETHPAAGNAYRTDTWFDTYNRGDNLHTGAYPCLKPGEPEAHGDYYAGLNKDSYVRPGWEQAYIFAYAASRQWSNALHLWIDEVNPGYWASLQQYSVSTSDRAALRRDLDATYRLSEWAEGHVEDCLADADGHWKGNGSGSQGELLQFAVGWVASADSIFVKKFQDTYFDIAVELTGSAPPTSSVPDVPHVPLRKRAVNVRTTQVWEKDDVGFFESKIDPSGKADFYAKLWVADQPFVEAMQIDRAQVAPAWTSLRILADDVPQVAVHYELWDEDGNALGNDDHCDINPIRGKSNLDFTFDVGTHSLSGDLSGVHDSPRILARTEGRKSDSDRAGVELYVTERLLAFPTPPIRLEPAPDRIVAGELTPITVFFGDGDTHNTLRGKVRVDNDPQLFDTNSPFSYLLHAGYHTLTISTNDYDGRPYYETRYSFVVPGKPWTVQVSPKPIELGRPLSVSFNTSDTRTGAPVAGTVRIVDPKSGISEHPTNSTFSFTFNAGTTTRQKCAPPVTVCETEIDDRGKPHKVCHKEPGECTEVTESTLPFVEITAPDYAILRPTLEFVAPKLRVNITPDPATMPVGQPATYVVHSEDLYYGQRVSATVRIDDANNSSPGYQTDVPFTFAFHAGQHQLSITAQDAAYRPAGLKISVPLGKMVVRVVPATAPEGQEVQVTVFTTDERTGASVPATVHIRNPGRAEVEKPANVQFPFVFNVGRRPVCAPPVTVCETEVDDRGKPHKVCHKEPGECTTVLTYPTADITAVDYANAKITFSVQAKEIPEASRSSAVRLEVTPSGCQEITAPGTSGPAHARDEPVAPGM
jgi:hypothetical protein